MCRQCAIWPRPSRSIAPGVEALRPAIEPHDEDKARIAALGQAIAAGPGARLGAAAPPGGGAGNRPTGAKAAAMTLRHRRQALFRGRARCWGWTGCGCWRPHRRRRTLGPAGDPPAGGRSVRRPARLRAKPAAGPGQRGAPAPMPPGAAAHGRQKNEAALERTEAFLAALESAGELVHRQADSGE